MKVRDRMLSIYSLGTVLISHQSTSGVNVYASLSAPRVAGSEAMVISASWESLSFQEGSKLKRNGNLRAIAMILATAKQYKGEHFASLEQRAVILAY